MLVEIDESAVVALNRAVAIAKVGGACVGLQAVAEMQIGSGGIHPELDPEGPAERNLGRELRRRNDLDGAASERRRLIIRLIFLHVPLRQFRSLEFQWQWLPSVQEF